jgi:L-aspartate oxidase
MKRAVELRRVDAVVIGAGAAGLATALGLVPRRVDVLSKGRPGFAGASPLAQGGLAAAVGAGDSPEAHAGDTLAASAGLSDPERVALLTRSGPEVVDALVALGARFDRSDDAWALGREAAHSQARILHARDATGAEIIRVLAASLETRASLRVFPDTFALELLRHDDRVIGVSVRHPGGRVVHHLAPAVILASGGIGQAWARTTNPAGATGDGLAMAARAGAQLADLEFVQFHPTALDVGADPMPLLTEALRGRGARIVDAKGDRFLAALDPAAELLPRDVVSRALFARLAAGQRVFLDAREAVGDEFPTHFPTAFEACQRHGLDPRREPVPIAPAAHYHMGGVRVDARGRTSLPGLWACGEAACTGVHGANRLASNSLLEALVFGARTARDVAAAGARTIPASPELPDLELEPGSQQSATASLRSLLWDRVGVSRDEPGLCAALEALGALAARLPAGASEARNLVDVGRLVTAAALARRESRGGHFRRDHPEPCPELERRLLVEGPPESPRIRFEDASAEAPAAAPHPLAASA